MFIGFNLVMDDDDFNSYSSYYETGKTLFYKNKLQIKKELESFICGDGPLDGDLDGALDGSMMQENWFPQIKADIFISHAHKNEKEVIELAGWLKQKFNLDVFIDSCVWGYADELLKLIDNKFCFNDDKESYNYSKRNYSTSHVHMMLSTALSMMIDKTECLFFINTPQSINTLDVISDTKSPWIYSEIAMTHLIQKKAINEYRPKVIFAETESLNKSIQDSLKIKYKVDFNDLKDITKTELDSWDKQYIAHPVQYALDKLYKL